ncbi:hypothetical protein DTO164E3_3407 [Paecilomyces variotii]|nr:hypothetical protein DTO032I3_6305 [Paecilomyces variotii]KAJ9201969.1 hypothetical protein DTO164E3_3407 [Paecilomyces variotii]KAJ9225137.1 hypothetical protein DTO169C6_2478 [Paecilomyces variotii]KAJ9229275.1 hypothetical protein DTO169E5_8933 [Paecilomyces variotii]KAJ9263646.1 hypothetical protein DTO195F2_2906 [Paecilomyces variotii]
MEALGAASSVVGIADVGIQTSLRLIAFAGQVKTAPSSISNIAEDISLTANILQQLGELMKQKVPPAKGEGSGQEYSSERDSGNSLFSESGLKTAEALGNRCKDLFMDVDHELRKASKQISSRGFNEGEKIKLSTTERLKWPFFQPRIKEIRGDLGEAKQSLMMLLQVTMLAYSRAVTQSGNLNSTQNSKIIVINPDEQISLIRSIVAAEKAKAGRGGKGDPDIGFLTGNPDNEEDTRGPPPEYTHPSFGVTTAPIHQGCRGDDDDSHERSPPPSPRYIYDNNPASMVEELSAWEIQPHATVVGKSLEIYHTATIVPLEQSLIQSQLTQWQRDDGSDPWGQWSSLTQSERDAFLSGTQASGTFQEEILHIDFRGPAEVLLDTPRVEERKVRIVSKRTRLLERPDYTSRSTGSTLAHLDNARLEREYLESESCAIPLTRTLRIDTKATPMTETVTLEVPFEEAAPMADTIPPEKPSGEEEAEKIVNSLIATYTTIRGGQ